MTIKDFSDRFDVLLNSFSSTSWTGEGDSPYQLDEYEKSVLLTQSQNEIVIGLYNGTLKGEPLESTEELRRSLDSLITTDNPTEIAMPGIHKKSQFFKLKDNVWFITYESANLENAPYCEGETSIEVVPMKQDEWHRVKDNPFRKPNKRKAVRLDAGPRVVELISEYPIKDYTVRYLRKPNPIILADFDEGVSIDNFNTITECELSTVLHEMILKGAVQLALRRITPGK